MNDKVIVVCVIGPQSSGKSTLLNFAFGTQFFTSTGRCTKGIYFTLQKFPDDLPNKAGVKWLIMLDTEGLQSPERIDDEYDRKIVLFAMLSSDVLIINNRGEIHATMINTLKVCCVTYDDIQQLGNRPEIIYTYGQNAIKDKEPFKIQVQDLKTKVIEAKMDSKTIEKTAEDLLGYNDDKINVFGYAYKNEIIEKDDSKGLKQDVTYKINVTQFGVETARILEIICKVVNDDSKNFKDVQLWITDSKKNWDLIDRFCKNIVQFQDLSQFIVDKKVMDFMNNQWNSYIINQNVYANDELKCNYESKNLFETFKNHGQVALSKQINELELLNSEQKDKDLKKNVLDPYDKWKKEPEQASITVPIELRYTKDVKAKNEVLKDQFILLIKNKLQEQKMIHMSKNGIKGVQLKAIELMRSEEFQQRSENEKQSILKQEFNLAFDTILNECQDKKALKQIKKNYFISLVKSFGIQNQFILPISDEEYQQIEQKVEEELEDNKSKDSKGLLNYLVFKMNEPDKYYQHNLNESLFTFNNEYILQIPDDPKDRIFDPKKQENFLELKNLVMCEYTYKISSDLGRDLNRTVLFDALMAQLQIKKSEKQSKKKYNFYGDKYFENLEVEIDDKNAQMSQIRYLFTHLQDAGFMIRIQTKNGEKNSELTTIDLQQEFDLFDKSSVFDNFGQDKKGIKYDNKRKFAKEISDYLVFERSKFQKLNNTILYLFNSRLVVIKNCNSPFETFTQHQQENYELKLATYVSAPEIKYVKSENCKQKMKDQEFEILVKPKTTDDHLLTKYSKLSRVAFRNLSWHKIGLHIINSVRELMNIDSKSKSIENQNVDLEELIKLNTFTSNQIKNLESKYLNTQLKDVLNDELNKKLCLYISKDFDAKISWCAIFVCWVELYKKAERLFDTQYEHLILQRDKIENEFKRIVNGKTDEITILSTKQLVEDSIKIYLDDIKMQTSKQIINNDLKSINSQFDTLELYKNLDTKYLKQQLSAEYTYQQFLLYVEKPNEMFEFEVNEMYKNIIQPIFKRQSINVKNTIGEAFNAFQRLLQRIDQQLFTFNDWNMVNIEKYFDVEDENQQPIDNTHLNDISSFFSPVIYEVLIRIMVGSFDMNKFQFNITNKQNVLVNYWFVPKKEEDGGPLQVFADKTFQNQIINFHKDLEQQQCELIGLIIQQFKNLQHSKTYEIFEINKAIKQMQVTLQIKSNDFFRNAKDYDENDFNCKDAIDGLMQNAIGCTQRCQYCNRKCELQEHSTQNGVQHSCQQMGHQMRVFAGGYFVNTRNKKIPSLFTCDIIDPQTKIMVDGKMFFWHEILAAELKDWTITYEINSAEQIERKKIFDRFWIMVGSKYCEDNGYEYIEKNDNIAEGKQLHESEVIAIALDGSGSMTGSPWNAVVAGAKQLINFIKANHVSKSKIHIIAIVFESTAKIIYDGNIDGINDNIWIFPDGGTDFDPPLSLGMQSLSKYVDSKDWAKFYFFTDGEADYPQAAIQSIQNQLSDKKWVDQKSRQLKLRTVLFCSNERNKNMELVRDNLNKFSNQHFKVDMCEYKHKLDVNRLGDQMIEHFQFNKLLNQD